MRNARWFRTFGFLVGLLLLTACAGGDDYFGGNGGSDSYRNNGGYNSGNNSGYGGYGNYYPYGNVNYPRNRIYIIDRYHGCSGYAYQGYCYRYKDDYQRAIAWDRSHGYDDNWHKKRKDWCKSHDCSRDHDAHDRNERDGAAKVDPRQMNPGQTQHDHGRGNTRPAKGDNGQAHQRDRQQALPVQREPVQREPVQQHHRQPRVEQPTQQPATGHVRQAPQQQKPQGRQPQERQPQSQSQEREPQEKQSQERKSKRNRSTTVDAGTISD